MDRRWIGIIIILIIGLGAMYLIVDNSTSVGNAITIVGDISVTLPPTYKIGESPGTKSSLYNPADDIMFIQYLDNGNKSLQHYNEKMSSLKNNSNITILSHSSNGTTHTIIYDNPNSKYKYHEETLIIFEKVDCTLSLRALNYTNIHDMDDDISFVMNHLKKDFKQNKKNKEFSEFTI